jgi:hypothetical protein
LRYWLGLLVAIVLVAGFFFIGANAGLVGLDATEVFPLDETVSDVVDVSTVVEKDVVSSDFESGVNGIEEDGGNAGVVVVGDEETVADEVGSGSGGAGLVAGTLVDESGVGSDIVLSGDFVVGGFSGSARTEVPEVFIEGSAPDSLYQGFSDEMVSFLKSHQSWEEYVARGLRPPVKMFSSDYFSARYDSGNGNVLLVDRWHVLLGLLDVNRVAKVNIGERDVLLLKRLLVEVPVLSEDYLWAVIREYQKPDLSAEEVDVINAEFERVNALDGSEVFVGDVELVIDGQIYTVTELAGFSEEERVRLFELYWLEQGLK